MAKKDEESNPECQFYVVVIKYARCCKPSTRTYIFQSKEKEENQSKIVSTTFKINYQTQKDVIF